MRIQKEDVKLLIVLLVLAILSYGWLPGALKQIAGMF
jgi:hypothetical protein